MKFTMYRVHNPHWPISQWRAVCITKAKTIEMYLFAETVEKACERVKATYPKAEFQSQSRD